MPTVAVVYLSRPAHGIEAFKPFAASYRKLPSGYPHELILLAKGMSKRGERAATSLIFEGIPHRVLEVPEDGWDIHAYLRAAKLLDHDYLFFCNTYTELASDDWLAKVMKAGLTPGVGLVGTSASFESIHDSLKLYEKALWLTRTKTIRFDRAIADRFGAYLDHHDPAWMSARHSWKGRLRRIIGDALRRRPRYTREMDAEFERHWQGLTKSGGPMEVIAQFPRFPNPHIRSTGFLISRRLLLDFDFVVPETKLDCALFESGPEGLTNRVRKSGLQVLLVGDDGRGYPVSEWPYSNTFRLGKQTNCITVDNHISAYAGFDSTSKSLHDRITWGDYSESPESDSAWLGLSFAKAPALDTEMSDALTREPELAPIHFSIVIPTRDRLELVKDAIETVRRQRHTDWELVVFDNASSEPLGEYVKGLADPRIKFKRSEVFLPVTESWNSAIDEATGDYVMLIGDDDGLKPGFFERVADLVRQFSQPDVIYSSILQFFHPGVAPWKLEGYVNDVRYGAFFPGRTEPFSLDANARRQAVEGSLRIRRTFTFNMQAFVFKKEFLQNIRTDGKVFVSPFPDYYLANVAFALANTVVVDPEPLAIAGVSRASFGFTLFNKLEEKGAALLNSDFGSDPAYQEMKDRLLPGPAYNSSYIVTMNHVCRRVGDWTSVRPDVARYRYMQLLAVISASPRGLQWTQSQIGSAMWKKLSLTEKIWSLAMSIGRRTHPSRKTFFARASANLSPEGFPAIVTSKSVGDYATTMELFESLANDTIRDKAVLSVRRVKVGKSASRMRNRFRRISMESTEVS